MKKILFVSTLFAPMNTIGAIRTTKFAKYLSQKGYIIDVITLERKNELRDLLLSNDLKYINKFIYIRNSKKWQKLNSIIHMKKNKKLVNKEAITTSPKVYKKSFMSIWLPMRKTLRYLKYLLVEYDLYIQFKNLDFKADDYDFMFTTYSTFANHIIGHKIKSVNRNIKWISDFRDPVYDRFVPFCFEIFAKRFAYGTCKLAGGVTAVSAGCLDNLFLKRFEKDKVIIYNGFDREDIDKIVINNNDKFTLSYLGSLYDGRRDLSFVFKCIEELINEEKIECSNIQFVYAGPSKATFISQLNKYNLSECKVLANDFIERDKSLKIQLESKVLLLASWNNQGSTGIVTGKFLEYMMMNKPIICTIVGDLANSKLKEMIKNANNGICYEQANSDVDYVVLKQYILEQYNRYSNGEKLLFEPNMEYIEKFNYKNLTNQLEELFSRL